LRIGLVVGCAAAIGACGSGGTGARTGTSADVRFADCMRAHGVPGFPDPLPSGGFPRGLGLSQAPAFQTAKADCISILKEGGSGQPHTAADRAALLSFARCMRAHGVPGFPDPVFPGQVPRNTNVLLEGGMMFPLGPTIDINSPAFQQAGAACGQAPGGQPKGG
jgi:hypothetical protein